MSEEIMQKISEVMKEFPVENRASYFQLKYFIIGKEPTIQGKMWTCLRELKTRKETIESINLELADSKDRIELLRVEKEKIKLTIEELQCDKNMFGVENSTTKQHNLLNIKAEEIRLRQIDRHIASGEESLRQLEERLRINMNEARFFLQAFESLSKIEPLKDFDDFDSQKDFWNQRLTQDVNLKMLTSHPLDTEMVKTVLALNDDAPIKQRVLDYLNSVQAKFIKAQLPEGEAEESKE
jgi:hypothetical protein